MKYNLAIANIGKFISIFFIMFVWVILSVLTIDHFDNQFPQKNALIVMLIMLLPPIAFFISWLAIQKFKDTFTLTKNGIETEHHGIIEWKNIQICSWKSSIGAHNIYLKLKTNEWLSIGPPSTLKNYAKGYSDLKKIFADLKNYRESLPEEEKFKLNEGSFISF